MKFTTFKEVIQMLKLLEKSAKARSIYWLSWIAALGCVLLWKAGEILQGLAALVAVLK